LADFQAGTVDFADYPDIESWPARGDVAAGEDAYLAPFVDANMDGKYRPAQDGDYPCITGDQSLWWVMHDDGPHTESQGEPMEIQVEALSYAYDCATTNCPDSALDDASFLHFQVTNKSGKDYHDVYFTFWEDATLGFAFDNFVGSDSALGLAYVYNGDDEDEFSWGYGTDVPAFGALFLPNNTVSGMSAFMDHDRDIGEMGWPRQPEEFYNYMQAKFRWGSELVYNGSTGHPAHGPGPRGHFMYHGDPGCNGVTGWSEVASGNQEGVRLFMASAGPFDLDAGEKVEFDVAFLTVWGGDHIASVCSLKEKSAVVKNWWANQNQGCFNVVTEGEEKDGGNGEIGEALWRLAPNPAEDQVAVVFSEVGKKKGAVTLLDLKGRILQEIERPAGVMRLELNIEELAAGMYMIQVNGGGGRLLMKR
ncbi:MAG: T9SS type A sorting domain-containing protein, partial [Bacteroidota bacterium]